MSRIPDYRDSFTDRSSFGFIRSSKVEDKGTPQIKSRPLWEQLKESQEQNNEEMEEKFRNLPPKGLDPEDIQFLEEYKRNRLQKELDVKEQENQAAKAFSQEIARTVITIEDKQRQDEIIQTANQLRLEQQNKVHTIKNQDLDLSQVTILSKKKKKNVNKEGSTNESNSSNHNHETRTNKAKRKDSDKELELPEKKKQKIDQGNAPLLPSLAQYGSSSDEEDK